MDRKAESSIRDKVLAFMIKQDIPAAWVSPWVPQDSLLRKRMGVIGEELGEFFKALNAGDLQEIADGGADLIFTVLVTMFACGIDAMDCIEAVCDSNLTKGKLTGRDAKGGKGPSYVAPTDRIAEVLRRPLLEVYSGSLKHPLDPTDTIKGE